MGMSLIHSKCSQINQAWKIDNDFMISLYKNIYQKKVHDCSQMLQSIPRIFFSSMYY